MPKDKPPKHIKPVKNRKVKIHNHKFETRTVLIHEGLLPCGPAFGYNEARKEIIPVTINGYHSELVEADGGYFIMKLFGYRCREYSFTDYEKSWGFWSPNDVFKTKKEAKKQTKFTAVDLPNEVYQKGLGVDGKGERVQGSPAKEDDDEDSVENCELQVCCANISEVRDQLIRCMERKGLEKWRIDLVKDYLESSHPGFLKQGEASECPNLDKILRALGILKPV